MARILIRRKTGVSATEIWGAISDLASHPEWMRDAESIEFEGAQREGVGTRMRVRTVVGPFRTIDEMEVTAWEDGTAIEVAHTGLITGVGRITVEPDGTIGWDEWLTFPWMMGGPVIAWLAKPILGRILRGNLERLEELLSSP